MLSSQGFEVKDLGEKKLKGLENPESIYLIYPHSLAGRLSVSPLGDKAAEGGSEETMTKDPGTLEKESELRENLNTDDIWVLWDLALRLEMICSFLENPERAAALKKPELSLLDRMKNQGGEMTDKFILNLLEHQVTRIEVRYHRFYIFPPLTKFPQSSTNTLQLRHMIKPFKAGSSYADHARPMGDIMAQLKGALTELENFKKANPPRFNRET